MPPGTARRRASPDVSSSPATPGSARRGRLVILFRSTAAAVRYGAPTENIALPYAVSIAAGSIAYVVSTSIFALRVPV